MRVRCAAEQLRVRLFEPSAAVKMDRVMGADVHISDRLKEPLNLILARLAGARYRFNEQINNSSPSRVARCAKLCNMNHTDTEQRDTLLILTKNCCGNTASLFRESVCSIVVQ